MDNLQGNKYKVLKGLLKWTIYKATYERCYRACSNGQFTRQHMKGAIRSAQMDNLQGNIWKIKQFSVKSDHSQDAWTPIWLKAGVPMKQKGEFLKDKLSHNHNAFLP